MSLFRKSNLAWEVRKTTSPIKLRSQGLRRSLSPSASPSHHHHHHSDTSHPHHLDTDAPVQSHHPPTDTSSHPHTHPAAHTSSTHSQSAHTVPINDKASKDSKPNTTTQTSSTVKGNQQLNCTTNTNSSASTEQDTNTTAYQHKHSSSAAQSTTRPNSEHDRNITNHQPKVPSRPSSARSLDFSTCSNEGRVNSPLLKRSKSQGKADSDDRTRKSEERKESKVVSNGPTWADRVRGLVAKPIATPTATNEKSGVPTT